MEADVVDQMADVDWHAEDRGFSTNSKELPVAALYEQYKRMVFSVVMGFVRNDAIAEDLTQDVFTRVHRKIHTLRDPSTLPGWIKMIAFRTALNHTRRAPPVVQFEGNNEFQSSENVLVSEKSGPLDRLYLKENVSIVHAAIDTLSQLYKDVIECFYIREMSIVDTAYVLNIPEGTVKRRLFIARSKIQEHIEKTYPDFGQVA